MRRVEAKQLGDALVLSSDYVEYAAFYFVLLGARAGLLRWTLDVVFNGDQHDYV